MKRQLVIRSAHSEKSLQGADLIMLTLREFGDHFFGFGDHSRALNVVQKLFERSGNRFSHQHALFGQEEGSGEIVGLLMPFTRRSMQRTWLATALDLLMIYRTSEMLTFLQRLLHYRAEERIARDEFYIAHLAVYPQHQRKGYGQQLLTHAQQLARSQGLANLSLLTEIENQPAITLYQKFGFQITETIPYPPEMHYMGTAASIRMVKEIIQD